MYIHYHVPAGGALCCARWGAAVASRNRRVVEQEHRAPDADGLNALWKRRISKWRLWHTHTVMNLMCAVPPPPITALYQWVNWFMSPHWNTRTLHHGNWIFPPQTHRDQTRAHAQSALSGPPFFSGQERGFAWVCATLTPPPRELAADAGHYRNVWATFL